MEQKYILVVLLVINALKLISTQKENNIMLVNVEEFSIENEKISFTVYAKVKKGTFSNSQFSISSISVKEKINGSENKIDVNGITCIQGETKGEFVIFKCTSESPYTRNDPNSELEFKISPKKIAWPNDNVDTDLNNQIFECRGKETIPNKNSNTLRRLSSVLLNATSQKQRNLLIEFKDYSLDCAPNKHYIYANAYGLCDDNLAEFYFSLTAYKPLDYPINVKNINVKDDNGYTYSCSVRNTTNIDIDIVCGYTEDTKQNKLDGIKMFYFDLESTTTMLRVYLANDDTNIICTKMNPSVVFSEIEQFVESDEEDKINFVMWAKITNGTLKNLRYTIDLKINEKNNRNIRNLEETIKAECEQYIFKDGFGGFKCEADSPQQELSAVTITLDIDSVTVKDKNIAKPSDDGSLESVNIIEKTENSFENAVISGKAGTDDSGNKDNGVNGLSGYTILLYLLLFLLF